MRIIMYAAIVCLVATLGCSKKDYLEAGDLDGRWEMIEVYDKSTDQAYAPPAGAEGKVYIQFSGNSFSGKTLKNIYTDGQFMLENGHDLVFGNFSMTQNTEDEWGVVFLFMLQSCGLQSTLPCKPAVISQPRHNRLKVDTQLKYIVTFKKA